MKIGDYVRDKNNPERYGVIVNNDLNIVIEITNFNARGWLREGKSYLRCHEPIATNTYWAISHGHAELMENEALSTQNENKPCMAKSISKNKSIKPGSFVAVISGWDNIPILGYIVNEYSTNKYVIEALDQPNLGDNVIYRSHVREDILPLGYKCLSTDYYLGSHEEHIVNLDITDLM